MKPSEWCGIMFEKTGDIIYLQLANMWRERERLND